MSVDYDSPSGGVSGNLRLSWHDHGADLTELAKDLCGQSELTDVTLTCSGGVTFSAHRLVLAGASNYFRSTFQGMLNHGWKHPVIFLKDVDSTDLEYLLQFIYYGEVSVPAKELDSLITVARELGIKGLEGIGDSAERTNAGSSSAGASLFSSSFASPSSSSLATPSASFPKRKFPTLKRGSDRHPKTSHAENLLKRIKMQQVEYSDEENSRAGNAEGDFDNSGSNNPLEDDNQGDDDDVDYKPVIPGSSSSSSCNVSRNSVGGRKPRKPCKDDGLPEFRGDSGDNVIELLETNIGTLKIAMNGFLYIRQRETSDRIQWRCSHPNRICRGTVLTDVHCLSGEVTIHHNHPPEHKQVEIVKVMNRIRNKALAAAAANGASGVSCSAVVDEVLQSVPDEVIASLPVRESLLRKVRRMLDKQNGGKGGEGDDEDHGDGGGGGGD